MATSSGHVAGDALRGGPPEAIRRRLLHVRHNEFVKVSRTLARMKRTGSSMNEPIAELCERERDSGRSVLQKHTLGACGHGEISLGLAGTFWILKHRSPNPPNLDKPFDKDY